MLVTDICQIYETLKNSKNLTEINTFIAGQSALKHIKPKNILSSAPESPEVALIYRQYAFTKDGWTDKKLHAEWQNYWLSCCRSTRCDYIFNILAECGIDREKDILQILADEEFWKFVPQKGKENYIWIYMRYFLRRYSLLNARKLCKQDKDKNILNTILICFNFLLPRFLGSIILGVLFLISAQEMWELPTRVYSFSTTFFVIFSFLMFLFSFLYLFYECKKVTEYKTLPVVKRALLVFVLGLLESAIVSAFAVYVLLPAFEKNPGFFNLDHLQKLQTFISFIVESLFIGIFLQAFWEEKTITEPL